MIVLVLIGFGVYRELLIEPLTVIFGRQEGSHGMLVPFIAGYFVWLKRKKIGEMIPDYAVYSGTLTVAAGFCLLFLSRYIKEAISLPFLSFLTVASGILIIFLGKEFFKEFGFSIFYLITMIPLPAGLYDRLADWWRYFAMSAIPVLELFGLTIYREGLKVYMPGCNVVIADSCSGARYLLPYISLGIAYAYLYKKNLKSRIFIVIATIPLSLAAAFMRLFIVLLSIHWIGCFMAGEPHVWISWIVFMVMLAFGLLLDYYVVRRVNNFC